MSRNFRPLTSARVLHKLKELTLPKDGEHYIINRNPRNLEKLRLAEKPSGYFLEKPGRSFWHKLDLKVTGRYVTAEVKHFQNGPVISVCTSEWAIKKHLFKTKDTAAYANLARVFAARCLQSGITEMACDIKGATGSKVEVFLNTVMETGVALEEPARFKAALPWDAKRFEKPWEVLEENLQPDSHKMKQTQ